MNASNRAALPAWNQLKSVHIIGVCGTLMGAFAAFLKRRGLQVTGSDQNVYPPMSDVLSAAQVTLFSGYRAENITGLSARPDLVIVGNVISANNLEVRAAIDGGYAYCSLPEAMEQLLLTETLNCVVSGTHGKTTTSSLLAHVLASAGRDPCYFIGGVSLDLPQSFHAPAIDAGRPFVLEGDEYDTAFWDKVPKFNHYLPDQVILTSIEYDHADIYPDFAAVYRAFAGLLDRIRRGAGRSPRLIACFDYGSIKQLVQEKDLKGVELISYGSDSASGARYTPGNLRAEAGRLLFDVLDDGKAVSALSLDIPGKHNALNALAVWIQARALGLSVSEIERGLASFRGVKRRQEVRGEVRGVLVIDDFAHHPTAVRETLDALKRKYPERRLVTVFEPRSATSRRKVFQADYVKAFGQADQVWISVPYDPSKIPPAEQFSSDQLVEDLKRQGTDARILPSVDEGVKMVADGAKQGDLVAVLSNGGFEGFIPKFLKALG